MLRNKFKEFKQRINEKKKVRGNKISSPFRVAIVGIDGSGKSTIYKQVVKKYKKEYGKKIGNMELSGYSNSNKLAQKTGKVLDTIGKIPSKKTAFEDIRNTGYYLTFPFFKIMKEKGKKIVIFDRYPRIDLELFKEIYKNKKRTKIFYPLFKTFSGTAYPNIVVVTRRKPEEAIKEILKRKKRDKHENLEDLKKMDKALDTEINKLKKRGIKVIEVDIDKIISEHGKGTDSSEKAAESIKKRIDELIKKKSLNRWIQF